MTDTPSTLRKAYHGMDSGLKFVDRGEELIIPSTGEIGRSFSTKPYSLLVFTNPFYNVATGRLSTLSIAEQIFQRNGKVSILNIGCGGCADISFFESMLRETFFTMDPQKFTSESVDILNADFSERVVQTVRDGTHPYFEAEYLPSEWVFYDHFLPGINTTNRHKSELERFFESSGNIVTSESIHNGIITFDDGKFVADTDTRERTLYHMKSRVREKLQLTQADIRNLSFEDARFDIVLAQAVFRYLSEPEQMKAVHEVYRVLKTNGFLFPEFALYQKNEARGLQRVTGRMWSPCPIRKETLSYFADVDRSGIDLKAGGILPTFRLHGMYTPYSPEVLEREKDDYQWRYFHRNSDHLFDRRGKDNTPFAQLKFPSK